MIAVLQRVNSASVRIDGAEHCRIGRGLLVFLGIEKQDSRADGERLLRRILNYRIFPDDDGKMNLGLLQCGGELLLVSQFTLAADTGGGLRPGFSLAMPPGEARELYDGLVEFASSQIDSLATGQFGADMKVSLENDGPVTFILRSREPA